MLNEKQAEDDLENLIVETFDEVRERVEEAEREAEKNSLRGRLATQQEKEEKEDGHAERRR